MKKSKTKEQKWTYLKDRSLLKLIQADLRPRKIDIYDGRHWVMCRRDEFCGRAGATDPSCLDDDDPGAPPAISVYDPEFLVGDEVKPGNGVSYLHASVLVFEKLDDGSYSEVIAKYDRSCRYRLEDGTSCAVFRRGCPCDGLMIPQVKFNNNMVRNGSFVKHRMGVVRKDPRHRGDRHVKVEGMKVRPKVADCPEDVLSRGYRPVAGDSHFLSERMPGMRGRLNNVTQEYASRKAKKGFLTAELERSLKSDRVLGHVPMDIYVVLGAIFCKLYRVQSGYARMRASLMPSRVYVSCAEIYTALMPGDHRLCEVREGRRREFLSMLDAAIEFMNCYGIMYDRLDGRPGYSRDLHVEESIMRSHRVFWRRTPDSEEEIHGYEIEVGGWWLYDFVFEKALSRGSDGEGTGNRAWPRCLHLPRRDYNPLAMIGMERTNPAMQMVLASVAYHVRYSCWRVEHGMDTEHNQLEIGLDDIHSDFYGGFFDIPGDRGLMERVHRFVEAMTVADADKRVARAMAEAGLSGHEASPRRLARRKAVVDACSGYAHVQDCERVVPDGMSEHWAKTRFRVRWRPLEKNAEPLGVKDGARRMGRTEVAALAIPETIRQEASKQREINDFNRLHKVLLGRMRVGTDERLCARATKSAAGYRVLEGCYLRSYSPGRRGIQGLTRRERARVTIDGMRTAEADYSSLHPRMLYAMAGSSPPKEDIYDVGEWWHRGSGLSAEEARAAAKLALLVTINARNRVQAIESFRRKWLGPGAAKDADIPWIRKLFSAVEREHRAIRSYFYTEVCRELMWQDGMLIRRVCLRMVREGRPALAIHDSVVVRQCDIDRAVEVMREEFALRWPGSEIPVKRKA